MRHTNGLWQRVLIGLGMVGAIAAGLLVSVADAHPHNPANEVTTPEEGARILYEPWINGEKITDPSKWKEDGYLAIDGEKQWMNNDCFQTLQRLLPDSNVIPVEEWAQIENIPDATPHYLTKEACQEQATELGGNDVIVVDPDDGNGDDNDNDDNDDNDDSDNDDSDDSDNDNDDSDNDDSDSDDSDEYYERPEVRSTADVIDPDDPSVLFFSDNEGCNSIPYAQAHPDWIEGQESDGRNDDNTRTYGFTQHNGSAFDGDYRWAFQPAPFAASGECVLAMQVNNIADQQQGLRFFRRYDKNGDELPEEAYYSTWFYFPDEVEIDGKRGTEWGFWNVFQVKNKVGGTSKATLSMYATKRAGDDHMVFTLANKAAGESVQPNADVPIPVDEWVHIEMYLKSSTGSDGQVTVWQNGQEILDFDGQTERDGTSRRHWSVNNYGQFHNPGSHTLYSDDSAITTEPVHEKLFGTAS